MLGDLVAMFRTRLRLDVIGGKVWVVSAEHVGVDLPSRIQYLLIFYHSIFQQQINN
jgi:hypothetical protein